MEQNINTIFHRPNAIIWSVMLTMWAFLVPSIICILIQTIKENNLQGPTLEIGRNANPALQTIKAKHTRVAKMETVMAGSS